MKFSFERLMGTGLGLYLVIGPLHLNFIRYGGNWQFGVSWLAE